MASPAKRARGSSSCPSSPELPPSPELHSEPEVPKSPTPLHEPELESEEEPVPSDLLIQLQPEPEREPDPNDVPKTEPEFEFQHDMEEIDLDTETFISELESDGSCDIDGSDVFKCANQPIYCGAPITLHESLVAILTMVLTFKMTGQCLKALLELISLHCSEKGNIFKKSVNFFKGYFSYVQGPKDLEYYCSLCFKKCEKSGCDECKSSKLCYLVKISLVHQLQALFNRENFHSKLRFVNDSHVPGMYTDVYDGRIYQEQVRKGFLGKEWSLSFQWYTDGAALFKSSKLSLWPVYLSVNELPYKERFRKENTLVPVLWCGPVKPPANLLVQAMYSDLLPIYKGVKLSVAGEERVVRGVVLNGTGDTPARSLMMNMVQFNGRHSCQRCEQEGEPRADCPGVRLFPYCPQQMVPRTLEKMINYGREAKPPNQFYMGCKGPAGLAKICPDFVRGTAIDPMHQAFAGIGRTILSLLIDPKFKKEKWSIAGHTSVINQRLTGIQPPAHVPRLPRTLDDLAYWKISELKALVLDYMIPILNDILPTNYHEHLACFVSALQLLSADIVTTESVASAKILLNKFVSLFPDLYNPKFLTINFHLLLHLPEVVEDLGPTWVYSCFTQENLNGVILSLVHGTRWAEKQIASSVQMCLRLPDMLQDLKSSETKNFCLKLTTHKKCLNENVLGDCLIFGTSSRLTKLPANLLKFMPDKNAKVVEFSRLKKGRFIYEGMAKKKQTTRDSTAVMYGTEDEKEVGIVHCLYRLFSCSCVENCQCKSTILVAVHKLDIVNNFKTTVTELLLPNTREYKESGKFVMIKSDCLIGVCVKIKIDGKLYISEPCNKYEVE